MDQTAPEHLHHIGRAGDVNSKVLLVQFMHDALQTPDEFLRITSLSEQNDIGRLAVFGDEQPAPERTCQRILKAFWPGGYTFDTGYSVDGLGFMSQLLNPGQVSR